MPDVDVTIDVRPELGYAVIQQFYARQMQLLDDGAIGSWAQTYTEDATFLSNVLPAPITGRRAIEQGATGARDELRRNNIQRRHLLSMLSVVGLEDDTVRASSYVMIVETREGTTALRFNTVLEDELVFEDGEILVKARRIRRDDLA